MIARLGMSDPTSRARRAARSATCIAVALLAGCATATDSFRWIDHKLFGEADGPAQVAYAGADRTLVYSTPDAGSQVKGVLRLHEEVVRYQSARGFAYVDAEGDLAGWVREQHLVARRPAARPAAAPQPGVAPQHAPSATPPETTEAPSETAPDAEPADESAPAPDEEPEPSVFDPY